MGWDRKIYFGPAKIASENHRIFKWNFSRRNKHDTFWHVILWRFYLTGDMTNLYPFIKGWLEYPFSKLFSANVSLWNQYKYNAFNIFSCRILIISYKILMITGISNVNKWINHIWNIMLKRHSILPTRTSLFIWSAGKIESVQEFKFKLFE